MIVSTGQQRSRLARNVDGERARETEREKGRGEKSQERDRRDPEGPFKGPPSWARDPAISRIHRGACKSPEHAQYRHRGAVPIFVVATACLCVSTASSAKSKTRSELKREEGKKNRTLS